MLKKCTQVPIAQNCHLWSLAAHIDHFIQHLSVRVSLSGSHTFLVVTHSLRLLPLFFYHFAVEVFNWCFTDMFFITYFKNIPANLVILVLSSCYRSQYVPRSMFQRSRSYEMRFHRYYVHLVTMRPFLVTTRPHLITTRSHLITMRSNLAHLVTTRMISHIS